MRKAQNLFYLLIHLVIVYYAEAELTKDFELSNSSCKDIYKFFQSTNVDYFFGCNENKKPNKFVLSLENNQLFSRVTFKIKFLTSKKIEKDNIKIQIDNFMIEDVKMVKEEDKFYSIKVFHDDAKGQIQFDIKHEDGELKVQKATLSLLIENCDQYQEDGSCFKCSHEYFLNQMTGFCQDYKANCETQENKKCKKCQNGYLLNESGFCTISCQDKQFKYNNSCVSSCPTGYYSDQNQFCQKCGDYCVFCHSNDTCLQCEENRYFQDGVCKEACSDGYFVSTQETTNGQLICENCDESCLTCTGPSNNECTTCREDFIIYLGNSCLQQCPEGYFKKSKNISEDINKIKNSSYYCARCYYLNQKCVEQCPSQTFIVENYICKTCSTKNCANCNSNDICNACQNEYILDEKNQCVECDQNTYYDAHKQICKKCPDVNCLNCSSEQSGRVCIKCKQYYEFNENKLVCQFNDTEYLLECANPSNCTKEQNIVKASDATINIISISNTILLLFSFAFFPIGPFFWYTVQVQQQIGNLILINNLRILSLGPTVIQNFYQYNIFPLFPDSTLNTYNESDLLYASSSQLSIMGAFRSQPLKKYFINNMAYFFVFLFITILVYILSKCINRKYIRIIEANQAQKKLKVKEIDCKHDNSIFDNSYNLNISCSLDQNASKINQSQNEISQIGQNLLVKRENEIQKQKEKKRLNFYIKNQTFLKIIEYNLFIRFQMVFGNYFLLSLFYSVYKLTLNSTYDFIDIGFKSLFSLIYIIFVCYLTYKVSKFDELDFNYDCSKFKVIFSNIKTQGLKRYFWILLEFRKILQVAVLVFVTQDLIKISSVLGTNLLFLIYLLHQKPISYTIYQKFIIAIEVIIGFSNVCIIIYQILPDSMINQKFIASILAIMALTILNFIVLGFLLMQIYMFVKFKFFPRFYILENKIIDTTSMKIEQGYDQKNSRFFNDLTNNDIDYYSKLWGINPIFAKKIYQEAQEEFRKKYEQEEIRVQQQIQLKEQSKQKVVDNTLQSQKRSIYTHKEVHGTVKEKKKLQKILSQSIQFQQNNLRNQRKNIDYNKIYINNLLSKGNIFVQEQNQSKAHFSPNNSKLISKDSSIIELQNTSQQIFKQTTDLDSQQNQQQRCIKLIKQKDNQISQVQLQKEQFTSINDSN
ncbi:transmembrane protein, putative (macronuclear) [Tetrahymena thermophila SB210]|uniref:Transmembrane protein, putative n=1 Tax=Tetrahymena thermophila (strain SB210) TaxID=312017 RepID=Q22UU7_TETTS|nr:transmembrane protein, putative [Tetrahymena thermophila SB210]EAR89029.2 transmembrane protein, putative [Tetrahymena thermophila SB210]|eukprot:XP_001009274.2 transmembrane protein, putative [Tetrahymena thermophila SB210]